MRTPIGTIAYDPALPVSQKRGEIAEIIRDVHELTGEWERERAAKMLEKEISGLESERAPEIAIADADIDQALEFFTDILKTADPKKVRLFFSTFVESITLAACRA